VNENAIVFEARPSLGSVMSLLQAADLPTSDLTEPHLEHFFACSSGNGLTGLVGVEICGSDALLRSLVVGASARTKGTGTALVTHIERYSRERGVRSMYLLTTSAASFFERLGYRRIERVLAPASIRATPEFSSICPASSAFMTKQL